MAIIAREGGSSVEPIAEGTYVARCYMVVDVGSHWDDKYRKSRHEIIIGWEIPSERMEITKDDVTKDVPRVVSKSYTLSLGERANLRKDLEAWRGQRFTKEELNEFDVLKLLKAPCQLQVMHRTSGAGKVYANVTTIMPIVKGMQVPELELEPVVFELNDDTAEIPENIYSWIADKIETSTEWLASRPDDSGRDDAGNAHQPEPPPDDLGDDSLPF